MGGTGEDDQNVFSGREEEEGSALCENRPEEGEEEEQVVEDSSVHGPGSGGRIHAAAK